MPEDNRIALISGGSRGLGRSTVLALAERGVRSIFTYHSGRAEADKVVAATNEAGARAVALQLDIGKVSTFDDFIASVEAALGDLGAERLHYLVNSAGVSDHTPFAKVSEDLLDHVYSVNFKGVFFLTQKLLPLLSDGGRIVNISTSLTRFWTPDTIPYASLKGAVEVFTHYLAKEVGARGITVNSVAPGAIATDFRRRYGARQPAGEQDGRRNDRARAGRRARRHRSDDRLAAVRRQPLGQRATYRGLGRHEPLSSIFNVAPLS